MRKVKHRIDNRTGLDKHRGRLLFRPRTALDSCCLLLTVTFYSLTLTLNNNQQQTHSEMLEVAVTTLWGHFVAYFYRNIIL